MALTARVVARGAAGAPALCGGLLMGDLVWLSCAVFGLAALAESFQVVFQGIKYLGAAYLLYLAWKLWTAPAEMTNDGDVVEGESLKLFVGGLSLALGNPKTMLFYIALLPTVIDLGSLAATDFAALVGVVTLVYGVVLYAYVALAVRARGLARNAARLQLVNRGTGTVMAGAAVLVATRS